MTARGFQCTPFVTHDPALTRGGPSLRCLFFLSLIHVPFVEEGECRLCAAVTTRALIVSLHRRMEVVMSSPGRRVHSRLPSLNNLLESEVILGDDDDGSSCTGEESEMHSALEDLSESVSAESKFVDCSAASSIPDVSDSLPLEMGRLSLSQSYQHEPTARSSLPRSNSTLSSRTIQNTRARLLLSPRQTFADSTASSRSKLPAASPFTQRRSVSAAPNPVSQPTTPTTVRKPSTSATPSPRPAVPPKPIGLSRQASSLKAKTPESPAPMRRSPSSVASTGSSPAAKFLASGKQASVIRNGKPATPTKAAATTTPPKRMDGYATLGRRPKLSSPVTPTGLSAMESSFMASRETKNTADKFATLPRRKPAKDRPALPKPTREPEQPRIEGGATLPRPKKLSSPTSSAMKPRTLIYHEKCAQTELNQQDIVDGQEASIKLRALTRQQNNGEEVRQLERMLIQVSVRNEFVAFEMIDQRECRFIQSKEENQLLRNELEEEREERQVVQRELERTTQRVAAMLDSMEGVEREFHSRGDSLLQLETSLQSSTNALCVMQEQLEARDVALNAQRLELDRRLQAEETLLQQLHETEAEGREMMEFLQAEKLALQDAVRDSENEIANLKLQIEESHKQLSLKEEECQHLVRLAEQRRHELAAMQAELKGAEGRTGSVLMAQGARLSAAALALVKLHSRMDGLLKSLMSSHSLPPGELEALVFTNDAFKDEGSSNGSDIEPHAEIAPASPDEAEIDSSGILESSPQAKSEPALRLVGSSSLQVACHEVLLIHDACLMTTTSP